MCPLILDQFQLDGSKLELLSVNYFIHTPLFNRQESETDKNEVRSLEEAMCSTIPLDKLGERRVWRDKRLAALAKLKRDMERE